MVEIEEDVLVQACVAQPAVEALGMGVLRRTARLVLDDNYTSPRIAPAILLCIARQSAHALPFLRW